MKLEYRIVVQRESPPPHTGGWTTQAEITDELETTLDDLREAEEVGVIPRAQVLDARQRLESILEEVSD